MTSTGNLINNITCNIIYKENAETLLESYMFKNTEELKDFIIWCKSTKVKSFNFKDISIELSELAFVEDQIISEQAIQAQKTKLENTETLADTEEEDSEELDELLFWSAKN